GKLIQKLLLNQKCMGYLVRAYYSISSTRLPNQNFVKPPPEEEMVQFIKELEYTGKCDMLYVIYTDHMHQPCRTFTAIINRYIKVCLQTEDYQKCGALIPEEMINQDIKDSKSYETYLDFATRKATPKKARKFKKPAPPSKRQTLVLENETAKKPKRAKHPEPAKKSAPAKEDVSSKKPSRKKTASVFIRDTLVVSMSKNKAQAKVDRCKDMDLLSEVALLEAAQLKKVLKKSKQDTRMLYTSGSNDGVGFQPKVLDELQENKTGTNEGTSTIPGFLMCPKINLRVKTSLGEIVEMMMIVMMMRMMMTVMMMVIMLKVMMIINKLMMKRQNLMMMKKKNKMMTSYILTMKQMMNPRSLM
nr:hypothetical protein [Tanacetum cinerariifolium]